MYLILKLNQEDQRHRLTLTTQNFWN